MDKEIDQPTMTIYDLSCLDEHISIDNNKVWTQYNNDNDDIENIAVSKLYCL